MGCSPARAPQRWTADGALVVDLPPERVGEIAAANGVVLHELVAELGLARGRLPPADGRGGDGRVTALVGAEWLKLRSVRSFWGYLAAVVAFAGIGTAGKVGFARPPRTARPRHSSPTSPASPRPAALIALVLGIVVVTGEFRHGDDHADLLATPHRERVLGAKLVFALLGAAALVLLALVVIAVVAVPWLLILGDSITLDGDAGKEAGRALLGALLWAGLGTGSAPRCTGRSRPSSGR